MSCSFKTWAVVAAVAAFLFASWITPTRRQVMLPSNPTTLDCNCAVSAGLKSGSSDSWSCGGVVYVSIVSTKTSTAGVCPRQGCVNPKNCTTNWTFRVDVQGDGDDQCCASLGGGVRVSGGNAPGGVILCGFSSPSWNESQSVVCADSGGTQTAPLTFVVKKADGTTLFTAEYQTSCTPCPQ